MGESPVSLSYSPKVGNLIPEDWRQAIVVGMLGEGVQRPIQLGVGSEAVDSKEIKSTYIKMQPEQGYSLSRAGNKA